MIVELLVLALLLKLASEGLKFLRRAFFHPLKHVPGPWYAALSDLWLSIHFFSFKQTYILHDLFATYGPVVRVGPDKVVFCDLETMRDIYLVQKYGKSPLYTKFKIEGMDHAMTLLDNASHAARRKASGPHYSASNIAHLQSEMHRVLLDVMDKLNSVGGVISVDCLQLTKHFIADIVVFSIFGSRLGAVERWSTTASDDFCTAISDFPKQAVVSTFFPRWAWRILRQYPRNWWRMFAECPEIIKQFVVARTREAQQQVGQEKEVDNPPLVHRLLTYSSSDGGLESDVVINESFAHLIAGTETTSTTLSYFLWQLSCSQEVMQKLQFELDTAMPDPRAIPDLSVLNSLTYLNAFLMRRSVLYFHLGYPDDLPGYCFVYQIGFRLHGAVSTLLERVVPLGDDYKLLGYSIPAGTIVGTQGWSMHRDPYVFPDPETFNPGRWLDRSDKDTAAKRIAHLIPFGVGTRICPGQHLAQSELRIALAAIIRNFDVRSDSSTTKDSMKMRHGFVGVSRPLHCPSASVPAAFIDQTVQASFPTSGECMLTFAPRLES